MAYAKDYGRHLESRHAKDAEFNFVPFRLFEIVVMAEGSYTANSNTVEAGEEYCMTLDWDQPRMNQLLATLESHKARAIREAVEGAPRFPARLQLPEPLDVGVTAKLGQVQKTDRESFVPLIVARFFAAVPGSA